MTQHDQGSAAWSLILAALVIAAIAGATCARSAESQSRAVHAD